MDISHFPLIFSNGYPADIDSLNEINLECFLEYLWDFTKVPPTARILPSKKLRPEERVTLLKKAIYNVYERVGSAYLIELSKGLAKLDKSSFSFDFSKSGNSVSLWNKQYSKVIAKIPQSNLNYDTGIFTAEVNSAFEDIEEDSCDEHFPVISEIVSLSCPEKFVRFKPLSSHKSTRLDKTNEQNHIIKSSIVPRQLHFSNSKNNRIRKYLLQRKLHPLRTAVIQPEESIVLSDSDDDNDTFESRKALPTPINRISPNKMLILSDSKKNNRYPQNIVFSPHFLSNLYYENLNKKQTYPTISSQNKSKNDGVIKQTIVLSDTDSDDEGIQEKRILSPQKLNRHIVKVSSSRSSLKNLIRSNNITLTKIISPSTVNKRPPLQPQSDETTILVSDSDSENSPNYKSNTNSLKTAPVKGFYFYKRRRIQLNRPKTKQVKEKQPPTVIEEIEISDGDEEIDENQKKVDFLLRLGLCEPSNRPDEPVILPIIDPKNGILEKIHCIPIHMVPMLAAQGLIPESTVTPGLPGQMSPYVSSSLSDFDKRRSWRMTRSVGVRSRFMDYANAREYKYPKKNFRSSLPVPLTFKKSELGSLSSTRRSCSSTCIRTLFKKYHLKKCHVVLHKLNPAILKRYLRL